MATQFGANGLANLDAEQVIRKSVAETASGDLVQKTVLLNDLIPDSYDHIALTYVAAGNGAGEIETVTFKEGGAAGTTVGVLTLAYDASNNLITVDKS